MGRALDQTLAVLNGLVGDYLSRTHNGLATQLGFYRDGERIRPERDRLARSYPSARPRVIVFVHGLMNTESIWRLADGTDYGSLLERDLDWTALYVRYNSGLAIAENGPQLADLLEALLEAYPVAIEELVLVGYSMGGLLVRSATHVAGVKAQRWLSRVKRMIYVGTPHLGAPAERLGKVTAEILKLIRDPYTELIADIGNLRSQGIQDLAHADLRHEDRSPARNIWSLRDVRHPLPLLPSLEHHLIAGSFFADPRLALVFGDSLVSVVSATYGGEQAIADAVLPKDHVTILPGLSHVALARHPDVYARIRSILE